jgi:DNA-binding transcriptional ArsR family regulator
MCVQPIIFQALSDPMRFRIVEALFGGESAVGDIVERVEIHQSGVSRHLRILQDAGFVQVRPEGAKRLYSLRREPFAELDGWMSKYRAFWEARLDKFAEALAERKARRGSKRKRTRS